MKIKILSTFLIITNFIFAQETATVSYDYGSQNQEIQDLINFENIFIEQLNFKSENLIGKYYQIYLKRI